MTANVRQDMADVKSSLINNEQLLDSVLANGKITNGIMQNGTEAEQLMNNLNDLSQIINKYNLMNERFDEFSGPFRTPAKPLTFSLGREDFMPVILQRMRMTFERLDYTEYALTNELRQRLEQYRELNHRWINVVGDIDATEINEQDWPEWLQSFESETKAYFKASNIDSADEVWKDSLNPRYQLQSSDKSP